MRVSTPIKKTMGFDISELDIETFMLTSLDLRESTVVTRKSRIRIFLRWLEENKYDLSSRSIEKFFYYLKIEKRISGTSRNTYIHALLALQAYLIDRRGIEKFMNNQKKFRQEDPDIIPLSVEEVKLIKDACLAKPTVKTEMIILLVDTGMRWEDGQALQCKSVDITGQQISYKQLKTGSMRTVHIEDPLLSILIRRTENKATEDLVFVNMKGNKLHYPDFFTFLKSFAKSLGIVKRVSPHVLRHSYAQNLYDQTRDIYLVKDVLGHKSFKSTLRYLKNSGKRVKLAQQMHPHLLDSVNPLTRVETIEKEIERAGIGEDDRFDSIKVKQAVNHFIIGLTQAIKVVP